MKKLCIELLSEKGISIDSMAEILMDLQEPYHENLTKVSCVENILAVISKREVQHSILTGMEIDRLAQEGQLIEPIQSIIMSDEGLYGIDEILALSIVNIYGSIGLTNFGYLDKVKPKVIGTLDSSKDGVCNTFVDDIVCAIIAAGASRLAHRAEL